MAQYGRYVAPPLSPSASVKKKKNLPVQAFFWLYIQIETKVLAIPSHCRENRKGLFGLVAKRPFLF